MSHLFLISTVHAKTGEWFKTLYVIIIVAKHTSHHMNKCLMPAIIYTFWVIVSNYGTPEHRKQTESELWSRTGTGDRGSRLSDTVSIHSLKWMKVDHVLQRPQHFQPKTRVRLIYLANCFFFFCWACLTARTHKYKKSWIRWIDATPKSPDSPVLLLATWRHVIISSVTLVYSLW